MISVVPSQNRTCVATPCHTPEQCATYMMHSQAVCAEPAPQSCGMRAIGPYTTSSAQVIRRCPAQMADAHELFATLRLAVHSLLRAGTMPEPAPLLPLMPGLEAQLVKDVALRLVNDAQVVAALTPCAASRMFALAAPS